MMTDKNTSKTTAHDDGQTKDVEYSML